KSDIASLKALYDRELFESVAPFWERHGPDRECGGYFSCLDRDGAVFDTDKVLWMQGRGLWCFSKLYAGVAPEPRWLELARLGADFLRDKGRAPNGDFWFSVDRRGNPLVQPYNIFTDCFCAAGFAEYGRASGEGWATELAVGTYRRIQERRRDPKGPWTKQIAANRPVKAMAMPMMQVWMAGEMRGLVPEPELRERVDEAVAQVLELHVDEGRKAVFERVHPDGTRPDCMEGRLLTPGHALETLWFIMRVAAERGDRGLVGRLKEAMLWTAERGWDAEYGGIYYYQDYEGRPTEKIESSMKLWWVHAEALAAFLLAYKLTGDPACEAWFRRIQEWTWSRFPDPEYGEWYGYLDRRGEVALTLKGGKWKGFFHIPRCLLACSGWLGEMSGACGADGEYRPPFPGAGAEPRRETTEPERRP
ncbi:MAG: AGE family epimerase/isomerase, partial [Spirochaetaceae bacterium]|nr:AGE family epimerase/isomerase [Spirochaetaceae bacterium]